MSLETNINNSVNYNMNIIDIAYQNLLKDILDNGVDKKDRTGTGTISVFGRQIRHKMSDGFPLLTTKKMAWKTMVTELLWFLRGDTNIKYLVDNGCHIWDGDAYMNYVKSDEVQWPKSKEDFINTIKTDAEFAKKWGELGPIYGAGWRRWKTKSVNTIPSTRPLPNLIEGVERTYLGIANGKGKEGHLLSKTWQGMIARCYDPNSIEYPNYGACNVYVCDRWLEFTAFAEDAEKLKNWDLKKENPRGYVLDKDGIGTGYLYSLDTCQWITPTDNANLKSTKIYTVEKDGIKHTFTNPTSFCNEQNISNKNFSALWTGTKNAKKRNGFTLVSVEDIKDMVYVDQISELIRQLKEEPDSRRMVVNAWAVHDLSNMVLPPCHYGFQVYTRELQVWERLVLVSKTYKDFSPFDFEISTEISHSEIDKLYPVPSRAISLMWNQRSVDTFLGLPFNIASYGLLLEIIAKSVNMIPEELIGNLGDVHLYSNHIEQAIEQIGREPFELPKLNINTEFWPTEGGECSIGPIDAIAVFKGFKNENFCKCLLEEDIQLYDYKSHPSIKAPLSN